MNMGNMGGHRTVEDAKTAYEIIRKQVHKELEILYVQERIRNKILKVESREIELNFHKEDDVETGDMESMISLLSDEQEDDRTVSNMSEGDEDGILEDESTTEGDSSENIEDTTHDKASNIIKKNRINDLLNLEAEYSGEMEELEPEDSADLEDLIDSQYVGDEDDNALDMFLQKRDEEDCKELRKLKSKFAKRKNILGETTTAHIPGFVDSEESMPGVEEIDLDRIEFTDIDGGDYEEVKQDMPTTELNPGGKVNSILGTSIGYDSDDGLFRSDSAALERLSKKNERKGFGFTEK